MPAPQEITAVYLREKSGTRRDAWAVHVVKVVASTDERLRVGNLLEIKGTAPQPEASDYTTDASGKEVCTANPAFYLLPGIEYRFSDGTLKMETWNGDTKPVFAFKSFPVRCVPFTEKGIAGYLTRECEYIGPKTAARLFKEYGAKAVRTLRESPEVVAALPGIRLTLRQAQSASNRLKELAGLESVTIEMIDLFDSHGLPKAAATEAIKKWKGLAPRILNLNPYLLMQFKGIGFLKANTVYEKLGLPLGRIKRQTLAAWYALKSEPNGHTWLPFKFAETAIRQFVGTIDLSPERLAKIVERHGSVVEYAIAIGIRAQLLAVYTDDKGGRWIAEGVKARAEERLAELVLAAMDEPNPWQAVLDSPLLEEALRPLSDHQREVLLSALRSGAVAILTGGPGSGKTFTAACLMRVLVGLYGAGSIAATAFTGKASQRFSQGMAAYDLPVTAQTTHSLLKVGPNGFGDNEEDEGDGVQFGHNQSNPLPVRTINVDEVSMDDVPLLSSIFSARKNGAAVLLVGDEKQLPPIGHGAPLRDLKLAGIPCGEFTKIRRNAGTVVRACKKLREKSPLTMADFVPFDQLEPDAEDPKNLSLLHAATPQACIDQMLFAIRSIRDRFGYDAVWQTQVIVARNDKGDLSRVKLNEILEREFNPRGDAIPGCRFRVGSKGIQLKNMKYNVIDDEGKTNGDQVKVSNGEFCRVVDVDEKRVVAKFSSPNRLVYIPRQKNDGAEKACGNSGDEGGGGDNGNAAGKLAFDLGNAVTCHKMQGSQDRHVVLMLDRGAVFNLSLEWLLTGWSRMEKVCTTIGDFATVQKIAAKSSLDQRKTFLRERIEAGRLWSSRAWWVVEGNNETTAVPVLSLPSVNQTELVAT